MIAKRKPEKSLPGTKIKSLESTRTKLHSHIKNRYFSHKEQASEQGFAEHLSRAEAYGK